MKAIDPKGFLEAVVMNVELSLHVRMRAAIELMPYSYPKLAVTAVVTERDFATLLDQRIERMKQQQKLIEARPNATTPTTNENGGNPVDARLPPTIPDRRFRRI